MTISTAPNKMLKPNGKMHLWEILGRSVRRSDKLGRDGRPPSGSPDYRPGRVGNTAYGQAQILRCAFLYGNQLRLYAFMFVGLNGVAYSVPSAIAVRVNEARGGVENIRWQS